MISRKLAGNAGHGLVPILNLRASAISASLCFLTCCMAEPAHGSDDPGIFGSVGVSAAARKGARAMKTGAWAEAQSEFRNLLAKDDDFYFGFYDASKKLNQWDQAAFALEQLFEKRPSFKDQMSFEYGECLFKLNRYDEAEPHLKKALDKVGEPSIVPAKLRTLLAKSDPPEAAPTVGEIKQWTPPVVICVAPPPTLLPESIDDRSEKALTYLNAFMKCEGIFIAEFKGYEDKEMITFNNPPTATYRIEKALKGPDLNKQLPIRFKFDRDIRGENKPAGWSWKPEMMPKVGSRWILFIPNCIPVSGAYETFHGSYGRQELNEANIDEVHRIIQEHQGQAR